MTTMLMPRYDEKGQKREGDGCGGRVLEERWLWWQGREGAKGREVGGGPGQNLQNYQRPRQITRLADVIQMFGNPLVSNSHLLAYTPPPLSSG